MQFEQAYSIWSEGGLTQMMLGICSRSFCRYVVRYEQNGDRGVVGQAFNPTILKALLA